MEPATAQTAASSEDAPGGADAGSHLPPPPSVPGQRLHRRRPGRMVAGVAAGLADYLDIDPTLVRIGFVVLFLAGAIAVPLYAAGWLLIPDEGADRSLAEELFEHDHARFSPTR